MRRAGSYRSSPSRKVTRLGQGMLTGYLRAPSSKKILYIALIIGATILFLPWVSLDLEGGATESYSSFHMICGGIGFFILAIYGALVFLLSVAEDREQIKSKTNIVFREHSTIIFSGILVGALCTMIFTSLLGYSIMTTGNVHINTQTSGIVFEILVSVVIVFAGFLNYKEGRRDMSKRVYIENASSEYAHSEEYDSILGSSTEEKKDSNMKLPI